MTSKGQVVIPEEIWKRLGLKTGSQFVVVGEKDTVILKTIPPIYMEEFDRLIAEARKQAKVSDLKRYDIKAAITRVRTPK